MLSAEGVGSQAGDAQAGQAIGVELRNIGRRGGASQTVMVEQSEAKPLVLHGWSKATNVTGVGDPADYSLYADVTFKDGTHAWAFHVPFDPEVCGWQQQFGILSFDKPVLSIYLVLMFRWRTGSVLFDDVTITNMHDAVCGVDFTHLT